MMRFVKVLIVPVLLCGSGIAIAAEDCMKMNFDCTQARCAKTPDSKECKACQTAAAACYARNQKPKKANPSGPRAK